MDSIATLEDFVLSFEGIITREEGPIDFGFWVDEFALELIRAGCDISALDFGANGDVGYVIDKRGNTIEFVVGMDLEAFRCEMATLAKWAGLA